MIGISLGHEAWFIARTPLNLSLILLILIIFYPLNSARKWIVFLLIGLLGMTAEWIGVSQGIPFGDYAYGENFGPKVWGVPYLIGVFWALLSLVTFQIAYRWYSSYALAPLIGAGLMLVLDLLMERSAPRFDFWSFSGEPPVENYISWFALALIFQGILGSLRIKGDYQISLHIFLAQLVFFSFFALN
jgi:putative membrane protein